MEHQTGRGIGSTRLHSHSRFLMKPKRFLFKSNLHAKLLTILFASLLLGLSIVGTALYYKSKSILHDGVRDVLTQYAELAEQSLDLDKIRENDIEYLKDFVNKKSLTVNCRLTIIGADGWVLADSEIPISQLDRVENHINRPEVQESLVHTIGFNMRKSDTIGLDLLYLSKLIHSDGENIGFLRLAMSAIETNRMLSVARRYFIGGGLLIFLISAIMVTWLSRKFRSNLEQIIHKAKSISEGDLKTRIHIDTNDEFRDLGSSLNEMAAALSKYLRRVARERRELDTVLSSIQEGIIAIASDKTIIFYNNISLELLSLPIEDVVGKHYYHVFRNRHLESLVDNFFENPVYISDELKTDHLTLEVFLTAFHFEELPEKGVVIVIRDITSFKKLEKIRTDFVANVSHEFKTPLAAIRGYAETLQDHGIRDQELAKKYVSRIINRTIQLEHLVTDLLGLARVERMQNLRLQAFDPGPVLQEVVREFGDLADEKNLEIKLSNNENGTLIMGIPEMFHAILSNLVDNAVKYTPEGGKVFVSSSINEGNCIFSVRDTGIGIPANEHRRIFERFYRVDRDGSLSPGTGLGLSIVKHLVELQDAEIWLTSQLQSGSIFSIKFPTAE